MLLPLQTAGHHSVTCSGTGDYSYPNARNSPCCLVNLLRAKACLTALPPPREPKAGHAVDGSRWPKAPVHKPLLPFPGTGTPWGARWASTSETRAVHVARVCSSVCTQQEPTKGTENTNSLPNLSLFPISASPVPLIVIHSFAQHFPCHQGPTLYQVLCVRMHQLECPSPSTPKDSSIFPSGPGTGNPWQGLAQHP